MSRTTTHKKQSTNRNVSVDRERLSNATIIGLFVINGNSVQIKLPSKKSINTLAHLTIAKADINGVNVNTLVQKQYVFDQHLDKNGRRDWEVAIFNALSRTLSGSQYKLTKKSNTTKTIKLRIFKEIGGMNKDGVALFGKRITEAILARNNTGKWSQHSYVDIKAFDEEFCNIYKDVLSDTANVNSSVRASAPLCSSVEESEKFNGTKTWSAFTVADFGSYKAEYAPWF
ncbi:hypothetical protein EIN_019890 [Entamoeba invadens IP1]|uniref:hypothetical protein n=1 Tax=Entamoeba invadens IP1 TaxID=370355 RepID=UPI0002C3DC65|nr:hypothetical protein EIN_019890 [Entamoeba invadens IP1]ELP90550.1 hypothetical protein EIN_019890 [Entamoeba invadens IP1]|eukprot:XP_004257321.1 hypothetical protein EIN_019890 [Entamoeba invadens IP1]